MGYPGENGWRKKARARGVDDLVIFTGRVPYDRMPEMLGMGDIALAPKLSLTEGSGKLLNYMAMSMPTVAYDTPAQRELSATSALMPQSGISRPSPTGLTRC